jgi:hypothetical protein
VKIITTKRMGWLLIVVGALLVIFSKWIVFPGLERLVGIETIVGRDNVFYTPDGGYYFTNPGAAIHWILSVAGIGFLILLSGCWLLFRARRIKHGQHTRVVD